MDMGTHGEDEGEGESMANSADKYGTSSMSDDYEQTSGKQTLLSQNMRDYIDLLLSVSR